MPILFKDLPHGPFRYKGVVYTKINDHQGVLFSSGEIREFDSLTECWTF